MSTGSGERCVRSARKRGCLSTIQPVWKLNPHRTIFGGWNVPLLLGTLCVAAIVGDSVGYSIGIKSGPKIFNREESWLFHKDHLLKAQQFYEKHGGKTIILARFVPIVRTFCPPVAGAAHMGYLSYFLYDICGGVLWVWSMVLLGYTLGRTVPNIDKKIHYVIAGVIVASLIPAAYHAWKSRVQKGASAAG